MALSDFLSATLPRNDDFNLLHLKRNSTICNPIVVKQSNQSMYSKTVKSVHSFTLFQNFKAIYGLEIIVYLTLNFDDNEMKSLDDPLKCEQLFFISKADTTGYFGLKLNFKEITKAIIKFLLSIDPNEYLKNVKPLKRDYSSVGKKLIHKNTSTIEALKILADRKKAGINVVAESIDEKLLLHFRCPQRIPTKISLFTKPAQQYLFPNSSKNLKKHILNGDQLIRWWASLIDEVINEAFILSNLEAKIQIPGENYMEIRRYCKNLSYENWEVGDIFGGKDASLAISYIPLFPDDPKSRFIRQLVEENRINQVSLATFWTELQQRQEFSSGVRVSVIGISGMLSTSAFSQFDCEESICVASKNQFDYFKSFIVGENYEKEEGAEDSYSNVKSLLKRLNKNFLAITGKYSEASEAKNAAQEKTINAITLQARKKRKP